ncbi:hypothetical protein AeRB84_004255 [Aphanomyces euteiches]|nr:hypothetical protein AeRB84_004255 [Aphanomyces euteiches]
MGEETCGTVASIGDSLDGGAKVVVAGIGLELPSLLVPTGASVGDDEYGGGVVLSGLDGVGGVKLIGALVGVGFIAGIGSGVGIGAEVDGVDRGTCHIGDGLVVGGVVVVAAGVDGDTPGTCNVGDGVAGGIVDTIGGVTVALVE